MSANTPPNIAGFTLLRDDAEFAEFRGKYNIAPPSEYPVFARDRFSRGAMGGVTCHYLDAADLAAMETKMNENKQLGFEAAMRAAKAGFKVRPVGIWEESHRKKAYICADEVGNLCHIYDGATIGAYILDFCDVEAEWEIVL